MRKLVPAILLCCMLSPAPAAEKWNKAGLWRHQLQKGMTDRDVISILGRPKDKEATDRTIIMYFQEPVERVNGQVTHRPDCGIVRLKAQAVRGSRRPVFKVYDWMEPNWELLQQMAEAKAAEIEAAKIAEAEAKRLRVEQARNAAELRREERRQQQLARKQRMEQERKAKRQRVEGQRQQASIQPPGKEPKEFSFSIFIFAGLILMGLAFFGAVFFKKTWD